MGIVQRIQPGLYRTRDGRYEIQYEAWYLQDECECAMCQAGNDYACPNDGWGKREGWTVWDIQGESHLTGEPFSCETYREARDYLADHLAKEAAALREP
jgi:hypothetical protein